MNTMIDVDVVEDYTKREKQSILESMSYIINKGNITPRIGETISTDIEDLPTFTIVNIIYIHERHMIKTLYILK